MSYHDPIPTTINAPGIDGAISRLQRALATEFDWMTVFGRAYPFRERVNENGRTLNVPKVWEGEKEYRNVLPNDFLKGQAFFVLTDEERVREFSPNYSLEMDVPVSLIVWVNTTQIPGHTGGPSIARLKGAILSLIGETDGVLSIDSFTDQDAESVFDGFSIDDVDTQYLMLPYAGLRINFKLKYDYSLC